MTDDFYQEALLPPRVVEVRVRLGIIVDSDHCQGQIEVWEPSSGVQLALRSWPHRSTKDLDLLVGLIAEEFQRIALEAPDRHHPF